MKINFFEGARRIALLVGAVWSIGVAVAYWNGDSAIEAFYEIEWPDSEPTLRRTVSECGPHDADEVERRRSANGSLVRATLCFKAQKAADNALYIPYRIDRDIKRWWGSSSYSTEVIEYRRTTARNFEIPTADNSWLESKLWPARMTFLAQYAGTLLLGLAGIWIFAAIVGWIVRGFSGIPMGQDFRPRKE